MQSGSRRPIMKTIFLFRQGEDGEIGPRGLPGESVRLIKGFPKFHDRHVFHSSNGDPCLGSKGLCFVHRVRGVCWDLGAPQDPLELLYVSPFSFSLMECWDVGLIFLICSFQGVAGVDGPQGPKGNMVWTRPSLTQSAVTFFLTSSRVQTVYRHRVCSSSCNLKRREHYSEVKGHTHAWTDDRAALWQIVNKL